MSQRRFAHKECSDREQERIKKDEADKKALEDYIMKMFQEEFVSPRIRKQINQYMSEYNYSYSGIMKALIYFYEVKGNPIEKANGGIGIVPYVYKDAYNYYYSLWEAKQKNEYKIVEEYVPQEKEIHITSPKRNIIKRKLFSFLDEESE